MCATKPFHIYIRISLSKLNVEEIRTCKPIKVGSFGKLMTKMMSKLQIKDHNIHTKRGGKMQLRN